MKREQFKETVDILAGSHGLTILNLLHSRGWLIASDVASRLDIHTTTASKYLTKLYEVGILERRIKKCRTRKAYEYKLRSTRISIDFDVTESRDTNLVQACEFYSALLFAVLEKTQKIGWAMISPALEEALSELQDSSKQEISDVIACIDLEGGEASTLRNLTEALGSGDLDCDLADLKGAFRLLFESVLGLCCEGVGTNTARGIFKLAVKSVQDRNSSLAFEHGLYDAFPEDVDHDDERE